MTVVCNGFPKTGTHALQRAVRLLGCKDTRQGHFPFHVAQGQHIHICRDPRNALVSWVRWTNPPRDVMRPDVMEGLLIGAIQGFRAGRSFYEEAMEFAHWLDDAPLSIRFEELIGDGGVTVQAIADYLQVPHLPNAYFHLAGQTKTYTGALSDWRDHWNPDVEYAWEANGGHEIEEAFGYTEKLSTGESGA